MKPFLLVVAGALTMCSVQAMAAETYTLDLINNNTRCDLEYKLPSNPDKKKSPQAARPIWSSLMIKW